METVAPVAPVSPVAPVTPEVAVADVPARKYVPPVYKENEHYQDRLGRRQVSTRKEETKDSARSSFLTF